MMDVGDEYAAFCLDNAVSAFGRALEHALAGVKAKGNNLQVKRDQLLRKWLDMPMRFREPGAPQRG